MPSSGAPLLYRPGVVYEIKRGCNASYIGETGNTLFHRFDQHMKNVLTYKNSERRLNGEPTTGPGRPPPIEARKAMAKAIKASAVVEQGSQCSLDPRPKIICRESLFHLRRIKEALIKNNSAINRDHGVAKTPIVAPPNAASFPGEGRPSCSAFMSKHASCLAVALPKPKRKYKPYAKVMVEEVDRKHIE
ncbi:hypothetical protein M513_10257 [Trichuris suis]|uniref:Uncharacterized protein n=1 Tax=Trichuris suis TaxID=68888 RepID=A0A085LV98_9BILA|nr:hypothetical protein M513_10257 [Trichuris suis]